MDVISALTQKRNNLIRRRTTLTNQYTDQMADINKQLSDVDLALAAIGESIKDLLCPKCGGSGTIRVCDAAGDMDDETCPECRGTGIKT